jgi:hypothetical protein
VPAPEHPGHPAFGGLPDASQLAAVPQTLAVQLAAIPAPIKLLALIALVLVVLRYFVKISIERPPARRY